MRFLLSLAVLFALPAFAADHQPTFPAVDSPLLSDAPISGDFVMGKKDAPITVIEYASLSCPHCAHFHKEILPALQKKYIDAGKVRYILRPFPLNDAALKAAELVDCVGEKEGAERYYKFVNVLFESQNQWAMDANYMKSLQTFAGVGGVGAKQFAECTGSPQREAKILNIRMDADKKLGVDHTPYLFINGHRYDDEVTLEKLASYFDQIGGGAKAAPSAAANPAVSAGADEE